jgi:hypothetical protein
MGLVSTINLLEMLMEGQDIKLRQCYVYEIQIDGVVRYIGKGRNGRIYSHLIDAKRTATRSDVKIRNLYPHLRKCFGRSARFKHRREDGRLQSCALNGAVGGPRLLEIDPAVALPVRQPRRVHGERDDVEGSKQTSQLFLRQGATMLVPGIRVE